MSVIPADIKINEKIASEAIKEQFGLSINKIKLLGEGFDNSVYVVNDALVFRFPRRQEAVPLILRELSLLKALEGHLSLEIPKVQFFAQASSVFKRPFYGHGLISGQTGCGLALKPDAFKKAAKTLGLFLRGLHNLDFKSLNLTEGHLCPDFDRLDFSGLSQRFAERLGAISGAYELKKYQKLMERILSEAEVYTSQPENHCLVHGDLYHRHLVFNHKNELSGVIDWGDSAVTDFVVDLAVLYQFFPINYHDAFFSTYGEVEKSVLTYAKFLGLYYAITLLWFGHDRKDHALTKSSLKTLEELDS